MGPCAKKPRASSKPKKSYSNPTFTGQIWVKWDILPVWCYASTVCCKAMSICHKPGFHQNSSTDQAVFSTGIYNCLEQTRWALMQTMRCHQMFVWLEWETNANQLWTYIYTQGLQSGIPETFSTLKSGDWASPIARFRDWKTCLNGSNDLW